MWRLAQKSRAMSTLSGAIDVHTHIYLPRYMDVLRSRTDVPYVFTPPNTSAEHLVILPKEDEESSTAIGRPIGQEYWNIDRKVEYMDANGIQTSILSLANPWLDFLPPTEQPSLATALNQDLQDICTSSNERFFGFGVIPQDPEAAIFELRRIKNEFSCLKGVVLSTAGLLNTGLDAPEMLPVYKEIEKLGLVIFLHPHYGVGNEHFDNTGHALFLALGFPFESTVSVSRLILSGMLDAVPDLKLLLSHAGGTLPFLAGRLDSCVEHDSPEVKGRLKNPPSWYLKRMYYDAIGYHTPSLQCLLSFVGHENIMFGTDNPFFPPPPAANSGEALDLEAKLMCSKPWPSTTSNYKAITGLESEDITNAILYKNAQRIFDL